MKPPFFKWLNSTEKKEGALPDFLHTYIHPCVINKQPHIIYPRGLQEKSPGLFTKLAQHYQQLGYVLKEDQRSEEFSDKHKNERRKWAPVILFTASLFFESSAFADVELDINEATAVQQQQQIELQLISKKKIREQIQYSVKAVGQIKSQVKIKSGLAQSLFEERHSRYQKQKTDPAYIIDDLKGTSNYYSNFPELIALIEVLKDKNWILSFDEDNWVTTGSGNMLQVDKVVIHFNTRSAAQLRLNNGCEDNPVCIASPPDA